MTSGMKSSRNVGSLLIASRGTTRTPCAARRSCSRSRPGSRSRAPARRSGRAARNARRRGIPRRPAACARRATSATSTMLPVAFDASVQATSRVRSVSNGSRSAVCSRAVVAPAPPHDARAGALEREPGGDVGLVIELADDDFRPRRPASARSARLIERMNDVALRPKAISSALRALTNAATLSRARAIIASTSRERPYGPPRCTLRASR